MNKPEKQFRCGPVSASIWGQSRTVDGNMVKFYSTNIHKSYTDGEEWKHTNSFAVEDLPKVALVANEAYRYPRLRSSDEDM